MIQVESDHCLHLRYQYMASMSQIPVQGVCSVCSPPPCFFMVHYVPSAMPCGVWEERLATFLTWCPLSEWLLMSCQLIHNSAEDQDWDPLSPLPSKSIPYIETAPSNYSIHLDCPLHVFHLRRQKGDPADWFYVIGGIKDCHWQSYEDFGARSKYLRQG